MLISWDIDETSAEKAYDFITEHGQKRMDCMSNSFTFDDHIRSLTLSSLDNLFSEFMKKFFLNDIPKHPLNLGLD